MTVSSEQYPEFYSPFFYWSGIFAVCGGFGLAGHLAFVLGFGYSVGPSLLSLIQTHALLQLYGFVGMLLIGISSYIMPRMMSIPPKNPDRPATIAKMLITGLLLQSGGRIIAPYSGTAFIWLWSFCSVGGAVITAIAIIVYATSILSGCDPQRMDSIRKQDVSRFRILFASMFATWVICSILIVILAAISVWTGTFHLDPEWHSLVVDTLILLGILPATFAFGIKLLAVFLRTGPQPWAVVRFSLFYVACTLTILISRIVELLRGEQLATTNLATALWGILLLYFTVKIRVFTRPHTAKLEVLQTSYPPRLGRFLDRGEFGRYELFIYLSYSCLAIAGISAIVLGSAAIAGVPTAPSWAFIRHLILLGYLTSLIIGIGYRLLPGLLRVNLRSQSVVSLTFIILFCAIIARLAIFFPIESAALLPSHAFGLSGILGMLSVTIFYLNLALGIKKTS